MICENCGKEHDGSYGSGRFCSKECARAFSSKNSKGQLKEAKCIDCGKTIYIGKRASNKTCRCEECKNKHYELNFINYIRDKYKSSSKDLPKAKSNCNLFKIKCEKCYFKHHNICKSKSSIDYKLRTLQKYCDLKISDYESTLISYFEIKNKFQLMLDDGLSGVDICKLYFNDSKRGNTIFKILELKGRTLKESLKNAVIQGKLGKEIIFNQYKCGWHKSWKNKEFFLRSSYEFDYAKELDEQKIDYEVEYFHIKYWDSQREEYRCAIPDFYIPSTNTIVEIKSSWTLDEQNMKDKMKAYKELGYNTKLICDHNNLILI